jgi:Prenyltransferase and squalene oxidase repeat
MLTHAKALVASLIVVALIGSGAFGQSSQDDLKVTPELERSVSRGLVYLATTQQPDGSWPGQYGKLSGVVGMAVLTFMAHGEMAGEGKYGKVIDKGIGYIIKTQASNGLLQGGGGSAMYSHGFATLALAEVYGNTDNPKVGPALKKAVGLILTAQNHQGGWRYGVTSSNSDTTVSGAQMVALRAAAQAGIEVPMENLKRAVAYYKSCYSPGGGFGYTNAGGTSAPRSGIGLLVLALTGEYRSREVKETADWCYANLPNGWKGSYIFYSAYYNSQAMYQAGGKYWRMWNGTINHEIIGMQGPDGSWPGRHGGAVGSTAMAMLSLEINYNYLPIYQR